MFLPDRYVRGTCPRCKSPDQYGDSCEVCGSTYTPADLIDPVSTVSRHARRCGASPSICSSGSAHSSRCCATTSPAAACSRAVRAKLGEWFEAGPAGLGHLARRAVLRHRDSGRARKVFLRLVRRADRLYRQLRGLARARTAPRSTSTGNRRPPPSCITSSARTSATFTRCSGRRCCTARGLRRPSGVFAHGFLTINGQKMSKSRGTFITAQRYLERLPPEPLRYYFAAKLGSGIEDIDFSLDDFVARTNSDLVGKLVNIASRCAGFIERGGGSLASRAARAGAVRAVRSRAASASRSCTRRANMPPPCARSWSWPIGPTATSISTSPGRWPRIRRAPRRCAPSPPRA